MEKENALQPAAEFEAIVEALNLTGPFHSPDPAERLAAVNTALQGWDTLLRDSPELISKFILTETGRDSVHQSILAMTACVSDAALELVRVRFKGP